MKTSKRNVIIWQKESMNAMVTCTSGERGIIVEKEISPENPGSVLWINDTCKHFRQKLQELGVLLAEPFMCFEREGKAIQSSPYVGPDLEQVFSRGEATFETLGKILAVMRGVLTQNVREVGLDAHLSNFCLGPDERIYYVDTFPALVRYQDEFIVRFPNPADPRVMERELKRKFDPLGILRQLRFSVLSQDAGITEEIILVMVRNVMGRVFGELAQEAFSQLPDHQDITKAVGELTLDDPDSIWELALKFMPPQGGARARYFNKVSDLSSDNCPLLITAEERVSRLREMFVKK